jgi:chromosome partitioning protein
VEQFPADTFETIIAKTIRYSESSVKGEPIIQYAQNSGAANAYRRLARELIARGGAK